MKLELPPQLATWLGQPFYAGASAAGRTATDLPVLVVGAGPAGLAAMAALGQAGVAFEGVEGHTRLGGIWDQSNPVSSVYDGLNMVTSRFTANLGPQMPTDWPKYPSHVQAREYLGRFAESEQLLPRIRFGTLFQSAEKTPRGTWLATLTSTTRAPSPLSLEGRGAGGEGTGAAETYQLEVRAIIVATGSHNRRHRLFPQTLRDQAAAAGLDVIHSAEYRSPDRYAGKRVLVVGIGNSGSDIAEKISGTASRTLLSVRTHPWIIPQTVGGVPCDQLAAGSAGAPNWFGLAYFHFMRRLAIGSFRSLGLTKPSYGLNDRVPMSDRGIVRAIRAGNVAVRSNVAELSGGVARFDDPRHGSEPIDAVIFATGFARSYPMLPELDVARPDEALLFYIFHRGEPGLAFMTELVGLWSCWPIFVEQARALAAYFAAEQRGGKNIAEFNERRRTPSPNFKGALFRLGDPYHVDYALYSRTLRGLTDWFEQ